MTKRRFERGEIWREWEWEAWMADGFEDWGDGGCLCVVLFFGWRVPFGFVVFARIFFSFAFHGFEELA